ncbi:MAG: type IX secretion system outer membrane channel protein PorV [Emticicia sp.]|uniref:type IX secretion system outer membrane channel protein PorV n=1 Tax=Emticicia sp. TaxID=1930953 RepID=UPI003BA4FC72
MKRKLVAALASIALVNNLTSQAQVVRALNPSVPFLMISPDSRGAALGDAGVASSPDANSIYWNTAKLTFLDKNIGATVSYTPWLRDLVGDMGLMNVGMFKKIDKNSSFGASMTYFDQGEIQFTTNTGQANGTFKSRDLSFTAGYSRKIGRDFSTGLNIKYIHSNLIGNQVINGVSSKPANNVAGDLSFFYTNEKPSAKNKDRGTRYSAGAVISNIGGKINYGRGAFYIPTNLKLGGAINFKLDAHNQFNFLLDANKLLIPTPPLWSNGVIVKGKNPETTGVISGIFGSFSDAPDGFTEEIREVTLSTGVEYWYNNFFALRGGYFMESNTKGGRKYVTTGLGFKISNYNLDLAYLVPTSQGSPLSNTWRISLIFDLDAKKVSNPTEVPTENQ